MSISSVGKAFETCLKCQIWKVFLENSHNNEIIDCHVVDVAEQETLSEWKKMGLCTLLQKLRNIGVYIRYLTTERHIHIRSYIAKEQKTTKGPP